MTLSFLQDVPEDVPCYAVQADTDYYGFDLGSTLIADASASDCADLCNADDSCVGKLLKHILFINKIY